MASRLNGPICGATLGRDWIDKGTLVRTRSYPPTPTGMGLGQSVERIAIPPDTPHKLLLAAQYGLSHFKPEIRKKLIGFLTIENFAILAAFIAADIAFAGTGVGTAINVVAGGLMVVLVGADMVTGTRHLVAYYKAARTATTIEQFENAGAEFAKGVTTIGIDSLIVLLTRRSASRVSGQVAPRIGSWT